MKLTEIDIVRDYNDPVLWDEFVAQNTRPSSFLQSFEWGEFNKNILGNKIVRWAVMSDERLILACQFIQKDLPSGRFFYYAPRGWVWDEGCKEGVFPVYRDFLRHVKKDLEDGNVFLRFCFPYCKKDYVVNFLKRVNFSHPGILQKTHEPESTALLDISTTEDELLSNMHSKTRYNIRLAEKKNVKIRVSDSKSFDKDIDIFYNLSSETAKRNNIKIYSKKYYKDLLSYFSAEKNKNVKANLYIADYKGKSIGAIMVMYFGNTATYLHGASSDKYRNVMANYLLQWQAIRDARDKGMGVYDFWGVSESNPSWRGITRFKKGFGAQVFHFHGTFDYLLDKKTYRLLSVLKKIKNLIGR